MSVEISIANKEKLSKSSSRIDKEVDANEEKAKDKKEEKKKEPSLMEIMRLNKPEWNYVALGCLAGIINGAVQPSFGYVMSKAIGVSKLNKHIIN